MGKIFKSIKDGLLFRGKEVGTGAHREPVDPIVQEYLNKQKALSQKLDALEKIRVRAEITENLLMMMGDQMENILLWVKDHNHEYLYANRIHRRLLHNGMSLERISGKTDTDLLQGIMNRACVLSDQIVVDKGVQCHFIFVSYKYESVPEYLIDVFKRPVYKNDRLKYTIGYGIKINDPLSILSLSRKISLGIAERVNDACYLITREEDLSDHEKNSMYLGEILIEKGYITREELSSALFDQAERRIDYFNGKPFS
jgi:hypothetical protein